MHTLTEIVWSPLLLRVLKRVNVWIPPISRYMSSTEPSPPMNLTFNQCDRILWMKENNTWRRVLILNVNHKEKYHTEIHKHQILLWNWSEQSRRWFLNGVRNSTGLYIWVGGESTHSNVMYHSEALRSWTIEKVRKSLPYNPAIPLLSLNPRELQTYVHTNTYTSTFTKALFIITKKWKQLMNREIKCGILMQSNIIQPQNEGLIHATA